MALGDFLFGTAPKTEQLQRFSPQRQAGLNQLIASLQGKLQSPTTGFQPIEQQARTQFQQQTIPTIAERFTALGSGGSQRSSAFQGALGQAGAGLEQGLAALKSQYGLQRESQLESLLSALLGSPEFENIYRPEQQGFAGTTGASILSLLPLLLGTGAIGLPVGAGLGAGALGLGALSSFGRGY